MTIKTIKAREILDSRGSPTVAVRISLENGLSAEAMVPSGASTGKHEALELRDGEKRYFGKGVKKAMANVNKVIAPKLKNKKVIHQREIDELMIKLDGTDNKSHLGANAILGVSLACSRVASLATKQPLYHYIRKTYTLRLEPYTLNLTSYTLPYPMMNILNGGKHADNHLSIQEFMIVPQAKKFAERIRQGAEVFHALKKILKKKKLNTNVGDEGGFAPQLKNNEEALRVIMQAIREAGWQPGKDIKLALDCAASEFYRNYHYFINGKKLAALNLSRLYTSWLKRYPIISIEDGLAEDDWQSWCILTAQSGKKVMLVGDDLFVTDINRLKLGIEKKIANAILIKLNQIGTLTETIDCINHAKKNNYQFIISHRSGETEDTFIADLAVATNASYIKTGSLCRSERLAKYNRLLEIAEELGS